MRSPTGGSDTDDAGSSADPQTIEVAVPLPTGGRDPLDPARQRAGARKRPSLADIVGRRHLTKRRAGRDRSRSSKLDSPCKALRMSNWGGTSSILAATKFGAITMRAAKARALQKLLPAEREAQCVEALSTSDDSQAAQESATSSESEEWVPCAEREACTEPEADDSDSAEPELRVATVRFS